MAQACTHLDRVEVDRPAEVTGCEDCLAIGGRWLHLRACGTCGRVGCCDSSPNRHATRHAHAEGHPIVTSVAPGETWSYCSLDDAMFALPSDA